MATLESTMLVTVGNGAVPVRPKVMSLPAGALSGFQFVGFDQDMSPPPLSQVRAAPCAECEPSSEMPAMARARHKVKDFMRREGNECLFEISPAPKRATPEKKTGAFFIKGL